MSVVSIVIVLIILGFVCWLVQTAPLPIGSWFKSAIIGVIVIAVLIWILNSRGFGTGFNVRLK